MRSLIIRRQNGDQRLTSSPVFGLMNWHCLALRPSFADSQKSPCHCAWSQRKSAPMNRIEKPVYRKGHAAAKSMERSVAWAQPGRPNAAPAGSAKPPEQFSRRGFLSRVGAGAALALPLLHLPLRAQNLKDGGAPVAEPHFPNRLYLFVWRNWELANTDRIAKVLRTTEKAVLKIGYSMGLPPKPRLTSDQLRRIYITVIRQNWHVLPHEQLIELLGWDRAKYEYTLKEDDFLWSKLGLGVKPRCGSLLYQPPAPDTEQRAAQAL